MLNFSITVATCVSAPPGRSIAVEGAIDIVCKENERHRLNASSRQARVVVVDGCTIHTQGTSTTMEEYDSYHTISDKGEA